MAIGAITSFVCGYKLFYEVYGFKCFIKTLTDFRPKPENSNFENFNHIRLYVCVSHIGHAGSTSIHLAIVQQHKHCATQVNPSVLSIKVMVLTVMICNSIILVIVRNQLKFL